MIHLSTLEPRLTMAKAEQISSTSEGGSETFSLALSTAMSVLGRVGVGVVEHSTPLG